MTAAARNLWRRLTSMRTALILLFLLTVASLPGALLPQWSLNRATTAQFILDNPTVGPWLDRLGFLGVFGAPWYAAIYLMLFTSLVGCVLPRSWDFVGQLRARPVVVPRNLSRLPHHAELVVDDDPAAVAARIRSGLRGWRRAVRTEDGGAVAVSAEKGYLREVGNLLFHLSLVGLLVSVAVGKLVGFEGTVIVNVGSGFCSVTPMSYDNFRPGLLIDGTELTPLCANVDAFAATYSPTGQATSFTAAIRYQSGVDAGGGRWQTRDLRVNDPVRADGQRLYLLGHGFTPHFQIRFPDGTVRDFAQPFEPLDTRLLSQGAVKATDPPGYLGDAVRGHQLAVVGLFAPTAQLNGGILSSAYPGPTDPMVAVDVYQGDLGMEDGRPQSVFGIDTGQVDRGALTRVARSNLAVGQSVSLPDGTTVNFTGFNEWVSLQVSRDPAQGWALVSAVLLLCGLTISLTIKRRRVWYRLTPVPADLDAAAGAPTAGAHRWGTRVEVGGLARTDQAGYGAEFAALRGLPVTGPGDAGSAAGTRPTGDQRSEPTC